ncbi:hypothetical protein GobsT_12730 [Gemmata obscuriglobus]|uniref:Uncharacterized protein n=1 Tax=Gemmata obscuriglobus TaxID=114 RepID=A0A2Z3H9Q8_9BACT|nr:hypothetical protein [Gemmata obscuriglobus]AWM40267.1 hypothetical protein C1280_26870 [Gemmata obscuriglobus]QEG26533.1 hypothetical protein GobsT_12730 [Gemmata obscuriglobus]VTS01886.1 unnamed protein product [Gemmata obscuriglobus UQM 2246]
MIHFRCWFCNRAFVKPDEQVGARFECGCGRRVKVPKRSGGASRSLSPLDRLLEALVYGGAGALIGFALSVAVLSRLVVFRRPAEVIAAATVLGFVTGTVFGERGINWLGQKLRDRENA